MLAVSAGPASALSTVLPEEALPLQGVVGDDADAGCTVLLRASDKMGNVCSSGGARVHLTCPKEDAVACSVRDREDGTYLLVWRSPQSGTFETHITIDNIPIIGSPAPLRLLSATPDLSQSVLEGSALSRAIAGKPSVLRVKCKDKYGNPAYPGSSLTFECVRRPRPSDGPVGCTLLCMHVG
jgi:hypothetical protein